MTKTTDTYRPTAHETFLSIIKPMIGKGVFSISNIVGDGGYSITGIAEDGDLDIEIFATMDTLDNMEMCMLYGFLLNLLNIEIGSLRVMRHKGKRLIVLQSA